MQVGTMLRVRWVVCGALVAMGLFTPVTAAGAQSHRDPSARSMTLVGGIYSGLEGSTELIELAGRQVPQLWVSEPGNESESWGCPPWELVDGQVYTLLSTTGGLSGEFESAGGEVLPDGSVISLYGHFDVYFCDWFTLKPELKIQYNETGDPQTVTGTVVNGTTERVSQTFVSYQTVGPTVTNQPFEVAATVSASSGVATGVVTFDSEVGSVLPGCAARPVVDNDGQATASCQTAIAVDDANPPCGKDCPPGDVAGYKDALARFEPASGSRLLPSMEHFEAKVGPAPTATALSVTRSLVEVGQAAGYTATVTPEYIGATIPAGTIEFSEGVRPVEGCASQPLVAVSERGVATATCTISYTSTGEHQITASYADEDPEYSKTAPYPGRRPGPNFLGSTTATPARVAVTEQPATWASTEKSTAIEPVAVESTVAPAVSGSSQGAETAGPLSDLISMLPIAPGDVRVAARSLRVLHGRTAVVLLRCSGELACTGKVTLSGRVHRHDGGRSLFGSAAFSIAPHSKDAVAIVLTGAGRAALTGRHKRHGATLTVTS